MGKHLTLLHTLGSPLSQSAVMGLKHYRGEQYQVAHNPDTGAIYISHNQHGLTRDRKRLFHEAYPDPSQNERGLFSHVDGYVRFISRQNPKLVTQFVERGGTIVKNREDLMPDDRPTEYQIIYHQSGIPKWAEKISDKIQKAKLAYLLPNLEPATLICLENTLHSLLPKPSRIHAEARNIQPNLQQNYGLGFCLFGALQMANRAGWRRDEMEAYKTQLANGLKAERKIRDGQKISFAQPFADLLLFGSVLVAGAKKGMTPLELALDLQEVFTNPEKTSQRPLVLKDPFDRNITRIQWPRFNKLPSDLQRKLWSYSTEQRELFDFWYELLGPPSPFEQDETTREMQLGAQIVDRLFALSLDDAAKEDFLDLVAEEYDHDQAINLALINFLSSQHIQNIQTASDLFEAFQES